jgi:hypothetical protein
MSTLPLVAILLFLYSVSAAVVCLPLIWWYRSIEWRWWELILPVVPFGLWLCVMAISDKGKSLSNGVIEPLLCGCTACIPIALRAAATRCGWQVEATYFIGLLASCVLVMVIYFGMPSLPE